MSKIDDLLAKMCPDGVEFKKLGEFALLSNTGVDKKLLPNESEVSLLNYLDICRNMKISGAHLSAITTASSKKIAECNLLKGDVFITPSSETRDDLANAAEIIEDIPNAVYSYHILRIRLQDLEQMNPTFIVHLFGSRFIQEQIVTLSTGLTRYGLTKPKWESLKFPTPPLEIQKEIVAILDKFTELEAELESELEARKSEYSFFRDRLLSFDSDEAAGTLWKKLGDLATNLDSKRRPVTKSERTKGAIPYYGASGIVDYVEDFIFDGDYLLVSEDGANLLARSTPIAFSVSGKVWINNHAHVLQFESYEQRRLIEIYLNSIDLSPFVEGGAQPKLNQTNMNKILVPVPPEKHMIKIVKVLDLFENLIGDLSFGLPAEIKARRQQYEYYRNTLLTFKELDVA